MSPDAYLARMQIGVVQADFPVKIQNRAQVIGDFLFQDL